MSHITFAFELFYCVFYWVWTHYLMEQLQGCFLSPVSHTYYLVWPKRPCFSSQDKDVGLWCPSPLWSKREKIQQPGNRMHMDWEGWLVGYRKWREKERKRNLNHICSDCKKFFFLKSCFKAQREACCCSLPRLLWLIVCHSNRVKRGCGGDTAVSATALMQ